jgi:hypothetical protein
LFLKENRSFPKQIETSIQDSFKQNKEPKRQSYLKKIKGLRTNDLIKLNIKRRNNK